MQIFIDFVGRHLVSFWFAFKCDDPSKQTQEQRAQNRYNLGKRLKRRGKERKKRKKTQFERCSHFHQFVCITATSTAAPWKKSAWNSSRYHSIFIFYLIFYLFLVMFDRVILRLFTVYISSFLSSPRTLQLPHNSFRCTFGTCVGVYMREKEWKKTHTNNKNKNKE